MWVIESTGTPLLHFPGLATRTNGFTVGATSSGSGQFLGAIDELETFNYVLSDTEIADNYNGVSALNPLPTVWFANDHVTNTTAVANIDGSAALMAVLVNNTNFTIATWVPFQSNYVVNLGSGDGPRDVWFGFQNVDGSLQDWSRIRVTLDTAAPVLVVTNPATTTVQQPILQVQGYCAEALAGLTYDLSNANGLATNLPAFIIAQYLDTNTWGFTTNGFQAYDVPLTTGTNLVTFHAVDIAGNVTTTNYSFVLDTSGLTNAPSLALYWPADGENVSDTNITLRGWLSSTAKNVTATAVDTNGMTNIVAGLIERNGLYWIECVPLTTGSNAITVTATDAAGNITTTNFTVISSGLQLTIDELPADDLPDGVITVTGTINDTNYTVWVNGVRATLSGTNWTASQVPLNDGGTAVVQARAIPNSDNGGNGNGGGGSPSNQNLSNPSSTTGQTRESSLDRPSYILILQHKWEEELHVLPFQEDGWDNTVYTRTWNHYQTNTAEFTGTENPPFNYAYPYTEDYVWPPDVSYKKTGASTMNPTRSGTETIGYVDGTSATFSGISPLGIPFVHYDFSWLEVGSITVIDNLKAKTTFELITGGKGTSANMNIIGFTASASRTKDGRPPSWSLNPDTMAISNQLIKVAGHALQPNGQIYLAFADNTTNVFTVDTPFQNYSYTVNQQKYVLNSACHADTPANKARTNIGVGEEVDLSFTPSLYAAWRTSAGSLTPNNGFTSASATLTAPSNAASAIVTASFYGGASVSRTFNVLEPTGVDHADVTSLDTYSIGQSGAGMYLKPYIAPLNVSFYRISCLEVGEDASSVSGYFASPSFSTADLSHKGIYGIGRGDVWFPIQGDNSWDPGWDNARTQVWPTTWSSGSFTWVIPGQWKVGPPSANAPTNSLANGWNQVFTIDASGTATVSKFNHTITRHTNEATGSAN